jgi:hypothetical protein
MNYDSTQDHEQMAAATQGSLGVRNPDDYIGALEIKDVLWGGVSVKAVAQVHDIGWAVLQMRYGAKVRRAGWNGKGMYVELLILHSSVAAPCFQMFTAQGRFQPGWNASTPDLLATDWEIAQ